MTKEMILTPARSLGQGNVFTPVCQSFCSQGVFASGSGGCLPHPLDTPLETPPWTHTHPGHTHSPQTHTHLDSPLVEVATEAGGTHPTGMHSCLRFLFRMESFQVTHTFNYKGIFTPTVEFRSYFSAEQPTW